MSEIYHFVLYMACGVMISQSIAFFYVSFDFITINFFMFLLHHRTKKAVGKLGLRPDTSSLVPHLGSTTEKSKSL